MNETVFFWLYITGLVVASIAFLYWCLWLYRRYYDWTRSLDFVFLEIRVPRKDSKEEHERERDQTTEIRKVVGIGDQFIGSLQGILSGKIIRPFFQREHFISLEYIATNGEISFVVGCPRIIQDAIEKQITSFYPEAAIDPIEAPQIFAPNKKQIITYRFPVKSHEYPFKTYENFDADPINNILNTLSQSTDKNGNAAAMQIMVRPLAHNWQQKVRDIAKKLGKGKKTGWATWYNPFSWIWAIGKMLFHGPPEPSKDGEENTEAASQEMTKLMEEKAEKYGFECIIRCIASAETQAKAERNLYGITKCFAQYGSPSINEFKYPKWIFSRIQIQNFLFRTFRRAWYPQRKMILSSSELTSFFHFPHGKYNKISGIKWQDYKIVKAPQNIPIEGTHLGYNVFHGEKRPVCIQKEDRFRHFYVIGQTGTGKSSIFQTMVRQDMKNGEGVCVVDPHGSLVESLLPYVPRERIDDVIIFDPSDTERPIGLNLLEAEGEEERDMIALDAMNIMIKIFDEEIFGPRIQDYFRNGVLTLMASPEGGTLVDIMRLFTDDAFQRSRTKHLSNPVVKSFWEKQMAQTGQREKQEIIPYFAAKFGAFVTNGMIRNIIGQTKSAFDFNEVMDQGKILFMNLSKGITGEINSKLLGLIITSKIQTAAMRRQKYLTERKKPRDFFLYIDEFQNYVSDSIESILSEARKYRLGLNMAHQYISQIDQTHKKAATNLKDAVFGNCGTIMSYKIGAQDAEFMAKEMSPFFNEQDLINIDAFKSVIKLAVDGQPSTPFSLDVTRPWLEPGDEKLAETLKQMSRLTFGRSKKFVEKEIYARLDV